jgi:hypothetical protein
MEERDRRGMRNYQEDRENRAADGDIGGSGDDDTK